MNHEEQHEQPTPASHRPTVGRYQIRVEGRLSQRWTAHFNGMAVTADEAGTTLVEGPIEDQAALHALLRKVCDLGLSLVSVIRVSPN